jgi:hypothetical protein
MNELTIYNKEIELRLKTKRDITIFPLSAMHRKELRELKSKNIGNLRERLRAIKDLKLQEFKEKNQILIKNVINKNKKVINDLNEQWLKSLDVIEKIINERIENEKKIDRNIIEIETSYNSLSCLNFKRNECTRVLTCRESYIFENYIKKEFEIKYGEGFKKMENLLFVLNEQYEEGINFGDLEVVKEIYYKMKEANVFFEKLSQLEIK